MLLLLATSLLGTALGKIYFHETFKNLDRWTEAEGKEGNFGLATEKWGIDTESTRLKTMKDAKFYNIAAKIDEPIDNKEKPLVLLLTVKHEQKIDCGGGYLKLMNALESLEKFNGDTQYEIMFGPDFCGSTKKVHAILRHGEENLLINKDVTVTNDEYTHQYVFISNPDGTFVIKVDGKSKKEGDVKEFWDFELPKEINDPDISKPDDWVDIKKIDDPEATKPDDWVEEEKIVDPDATMPEDWDPEDDGDWEAPLIDNPDYKGPWRAPKIDNPDYKGPWEHPQIPNPDYKEVIDPHYRLPINYVGFDLWQVKSGTLFGDIILADSEDDIEKFIWSKAMHDEEKDAKDEFDNPPEGEDEDEAQDIDELDKETKEEAGEESQPVEPDVTAEHVEPGDSAGDKDCAEDDDKCTMEGEGETKDDGPKHSEL